MSECLAISDDFDLQWRRPAKQLPAPIRPSADWVIATSAIADMRMPVWQDLIASKLAEIESLKPHWDGRHAPPISIAAIQFARRILNLSAEIPAPQVVPVSNGAIQLEWHAGGIDMELEIREPYSMHLYFEDSTSGHQFDDEIIGPDLAPVFWALGVLKNSA